MGPAIASGRHSEEPVSAPTVKGAHLLSNNPTCVISASPAGKPEQAGARRDACGQNTSGLLNGMRVRMGRGRGSPFSQSRDRRGSTYAWMKSILTHGMDHDRPPMRREDLQWLIDIIVGRVESRSMREAAFRSP